MTERRVVAERRENLVAVHLGHDDVEEDHVDRGRLEVTEPLERFAAVARFDWLMTETAQEPRQELAVERRVVDDEDPAGRIRSSVCRGHAARRRHAVPPTTAGRARS